MIGVFVQLNSSSKRPVGYVLDGTGCWEWVGTKCNGYGQIAVDGTVKRAHRVVYEAENGPIGDGLVIDHLCRNPGCVNPAHLEPVTMKENVLRGVGLSAINANKTHCYQGHPLDGDNIRRYRGERICRKCHAIAARRARAKKKAGSP